MSTLDFCIDATRPELRELGVTLLIDRSAWTPQGAPATAQGSSSHVLFLPTWTPGSYLIREYSRHLGRVEAEDAVTGAPIPCAKVAKNRFRLDLAASTRSVRVRYRVYAHELSVRTADLTAEHAYWNHACILLWPLGAPSLEARLLVQKPRGWQLACALPKVGPPLDAAFPAAAPSNTDCDSVLLAARNLDHAVDSPCLAGRFLQLDWRVLGVPHSIVLDGLGSVQPPTNLLRDLTSIVQSAAAVFGGTLPYQSYLFQCLFTAEAHGGLEHADSTTLLMSRTALRSEKGYREFLALAAHELFHAWNVKRLRPAEFWTYDYEHENYTTLLWLIEGWTAYYDDLLCLRAGLVGPTDYLATMAKNLNAMLGGQGRFHSSLEESSFDAWIRLYRPDENTRNSSQNYYGNGAVAAMCLDLVIRRESAGRHSLDDVLRSLYGTTYAAGRGYTMADVVAAVQDAAGPRGADALRQLVTGSLDPDLGGMLASFGVRLVAKEKERPYLGVTFEADRTVLASVHKGSPAYDAGLAPGDEILAIQGLRVDSRVWQDVFQCVAAVGQPLEVLWSRRGVIGQGTVVPRTGPGSVSLELDASATAEQQGLRDAWLPRPDAATSPGTSAP